MIASNGIQHTNSAKASTINHN